MPGSGWATRANEIFPRGSIAKIYMNVKAPHTLLALDLDGTLLNGTGRVSPRTQRAVAAAAAAGFAVCLATGRNWTESQGVLDELNHQDLCVFVGGAMVVDPAKRQILYQQPMHPLLAAQASDLLERLGHAVLALQDTQAAGVDYLISEGIALNESTSQWISATRSIVKRGGKLGKYAHPHTLRVGIVAEPRQVAVALEALRTALANRVVCQNLHVPSYGMEVLEVFDPTVNKWEAVRRVAGLRHIDPRKIIAVGDDINDLPMIRQAPLGVAMGNAKPAVLEAAGRVIGKNIDDGLAIFLEELADKGDLAIQPE